MNPSTASTPIEALLAPLELLTDDLGIVSFVLFPNVKLSSPRSEASKDLGFAISNLLWVFFDV